MRRLLVSTLALGAILIFSACSSCSSDKKETPPETNGTEKPENGENSSKEYKLVWSDEFNNEPNSDGTYPMPSSEWWYETGNHGWGNNEPQNYVKGEHDGLRVAEIRDGCLVITAHKLDKPLDGSKYISARINTEKSWTYGKFEMRAKLPGGKGSWSAFWMMPKNFTAWPLDGEIDIMEYVGYNPNVVHASVHTETYNHKIGTQKTATRKMKDVENEFHVYAIEWDENEIVGYIDGNAYFNFPNDKKGDKNTWPFDDPFYLKLNLAIGGDWGGQQGIDDSIFPLEYFIDYVRVYQK